jgi:hypothetical protein
MEGNECVDYSAKSGYWEKCTGQRRSSGMFIFGGDGRLQFR